MIRQNEVLPLRQFLFSIIFFFTLVFFPVLIAAEENSALEIWTHWTDGRTTGGTETFLEETISDFEALYPHIKVKSRLLSKFRIIENLNTLLPLGKGPDIFYADPMPFQAHPWVLNGYLLDLRELLDWSRFRKDAYELPWQYPDGGIYGFPLEVAEYAIYYNRKIFAEAGITIPSSGKFSTGEFLNVVRMFRERGIIPIAIGNQDEGFASPMLLQGLLIRFAGAEKIKKLPLHETLWTDPDIVAAFRYMKELVDTGIFPKDMNRLTFQQGRELFLRGKAAMCVDGTWFFSKIADKDGNLPGTWHDNLGAMDYPTVPHGKGNRSIERITGWSYVVRKDSPHIREAVQFLNFLTYRPNALRWFRYRQQLYGINLDFTEHISFPYILELFRSRADVQDIVIPGPMFLLNPKELDVWKYDVGMLFMGGKLSVEEITQRLADAARSE